MASRLAVGVWFRPASRGSASATSWHESPHRPRVEQLEERLLLDGVGLAGDGSADHSTPDQSTHSLPVTAAATGFIDVTAAAGLETTPVRTMGNPVWADVNGDGWLDLFISRHMNGYSLYLNNGDGTLTDRQILDYDVSLNWDLHAGAWGDFDNDGLIDLYIGFGGAGGDISATKANQLYLNQGDGTFVETSLTAGVQVPSQRSQSVQLVDQDNDGWLDIFVLNNFGPHQLFHNNGDGTFTDIAPSLGLDDAGDPGSQLFRQGAWADYDGDGDMDLVLNGDSDTLWRNDGSTFTLVGSGLGGTASFAWGDYNNDGHIDLFAAKTVMSDSRLYLNNGDGTYSNVTGGVLTAPLQKVGSAQGASAAWGDYDNDGDLDLYVVNAEQPFGENAPDYLFRNNGNGTFTEVLVDEGLAIAFPGHGQGVAWADYNNDGFLDLTLTNGGFVHSYLPAGPDVLYENLGNSNHWLKIVPVGTSSNAAAIGAQVTITSGGNEQFRELNAGGGGPFVSQGHGPLHFGLGTATSVDSIVVEWPSGLIEQFGSVAADQMITLVEGTGTLL